MLSAVVVAAAAVASGDGAVRKSEVAPEVIVVKGEVRRQEHCSFTDFTCYFVLDVWSK